MLDSAISMILLLKLLEICALEQLNNVKLKVRMREHEVNAHAVSHALEKNEHVEKVLTSSRTIFFSADSMKVLESLLFRFSTPAFLPILSTLSTRSRLR